MRPIVSGKPGSIGIITVKLFGRSRQGNFPLFPDLEPGGRATNLAKRWSAEDIRDLKTLAQEYSVQAIAERMDRTVGGVAFKAHQLAVKARSRATDPESRDFSWTESDNRPPASDEYR